MPFATFKNVYSVSSEDVIHNAANLLKSDPAKKWKTASSSEKLAYVILQFEKPEIITGVDIGNEHSAFIEVLVGKNGWPSDKFKELILTSSFMTPTESRNSNNINRIRCFNTSDDAWIKTNSRDKWDLIKFVCTQPFNKHVPYGISLVKVHVAAVQEKKELVPTVFLQQQQKQKSDSESENNSSKLFVGKFRLREDSDEDNDDLYNKDSSTLFNRWKKQGTTPEFDKKQNTAATIRDASRNSETPIIVKKLKLDKHNTSGSNKQNRDINMKILDRNRNDLLYKKEDESSDEQLEKKIEIDRKHLQNKEKEKEKLKQKKNQKPHTNQTIQDNSCNVSNVSNRKIIKPSTSKMKDLFNSDSSNDESLMVQVQNPSLTEKLNNNASKRPSSEMIQKLEVKKKKIINKYKPFNRLLENVVIVISGIQNPLRADIRSKALQLGAKYKPDWDPTCTHLICAFKNTPKYNQVKNLGGKIIKKTWVENCYKLKKKIPWRRYALDSDEEEKPESEEEILEESMKPETDSDQSSESNFSASLTTRKTPPKQSPKKQNNQIETNLPASFEDQCSVTISIEKTPSSKKLSVTQCDTDNASENKTLQKNTFNELEVKQKRILNIQSPQKENHALEIKLSPTNNLKDVYDATTDEDDYTKSKKQREEPNKTAKKDFFKDLNFFLDNKLSVIDKNKLIHVIEEFGGKLLDSLNNVDYIISNNSSNYHELKSFKTEIVKPLWIYECNDMECLIPTKRYLLT